MDNTVAFRRLCSLVALGLRIHIRSPLTLFSITLGFATFSFVMSFIWTGSHAIASLLDASGRPDRIIVLARGADTIGQSSIGQDRLGAVDVLLGTFHLTRIERALSATTTVQTPLCETPISVAVTAADTISSVGQTDDQAEVERGHALVGRSLADRCQISSGRSIAIGSEEFQVDVARQVSHTIADSGIRMSPVDLRRVFGLNDQFNALILTAPEVYQRPLADMIGRNSAGRLEAISERAYYRRQAGQLLVPTVLFSIEFGGLILVGAFVGLLLAMETAISSRLRELGILLALGFEGGELSLSIAVEAAALAVGGATIGGIAGSAILIGSTVPMFDVSSHGQVLVSLRPSWMVLAVVIMTALVISMIGSLALARRMLGRICGTLQEVVKTV